MLKKLIPLSLSLMLCASVLPAQASAMDVPDKEPQRALCTRCGFPA